MLHNLHELEDFAISATDGTIGHVKDFYFDDKEWVIRYLIVDTGLWLASKKVLISPIAIGQPDWIERVLPVSITKKQVKSSPEIDTEKPVSRQHEIEYSGHYGHPYYWGGAGLWGGGTYPNMMMPNYDDFASAPHALRTEAQIIGARAEAAQHADDDPHLRSCRTITSYHVEATDGDIGHVQGMLVDDETWAIRYIIVNTSNWWLGHQVLIAPQRARDVSWHDATVSVNLTQQAVKDAPRYDSAVPLDRAYEMDIHDHYATQAAIAAKQDLHSAHS